MPVDRSAWDAQFGSGLRSEYDFTILMATFTTDARVADGTTLLMLLSGVDENDEPSEEMLSMGADWETIDGGITARHPRGSATVNRSTNYGQFCAFAADACIKAGDVGDWIFSADAKDARIWVGTKWRMKEKKVGEPFFNRRTNTQVEARYRLMPDEYLGRDETAAPIVPPVSPPVAVSPPLPPPTPTAAVPTPEIATEPPLVSSNGADSRSIASALAKTHLSYREFLSAALNNPTISVDDGLVPQLLDQSEEGFYAKNK